jgi:hypothetical protein
MSIVREHSTGFGPTLAAEKLAEHQDRSVSRGTLRSRMIVDGLLGQSPASASFPAPTTLTSELVQIDGSVHASFETRGGTCPLPVVVDDVANCIRRFADLRAQWRTEEREIALVLVDGSALAVGFAPREQRRRLTR